MHTCKSWENACKSKAKEKTEYICPKEEFKHILNRFPENSNFYLSLVVPYNLGTRLSETFGIDLNSDIDFDNHTISIRQQLTKENGKLFLFHISLQNLLL